jgi:hypothetical protein
MKFSRLASAGLVLAFLATTVRAGTNSEFWPELDTWIRLNDATRLLLITNGTRDRDSGDRVNAEGQAYVDYRYSDRISYRAGYVYSDTPPTTPGQGHSVERRWVLDFSYNWKLGESSKLTNRVRTDLRDIEGDSSYRIRDRLKLEHDMKLGRQTVTPYGNLEAFYDSRYDTVSRYRLEIGATTPLSKDIEIDLYVAGSATPNPKISTPTALE